MTNTSSLTNVQFPLPGVNKNNRTLAWWYGRLASRLRNPEHSGRTLPSPILSPRKYARHGSEGGQTFLRPHVQLQAGPKAAFEEQGTKTNQAVFLEPDEVLARVGVKGIDEIEFIFAEPRPFYLRLIPTTARRERLNYSELSELVRQRRLDGFLRERYPRDVLDATCFSRVP